MRKSVAIKATAFLLCVLSLITVSLSVFAFVGMISGSFYTKPIEYVREGALSDIAYSEAYNAANKFHYATSESMEKYTSSRNFYFEIRDLGGNLLYSNLDGKEYDFSYTHIRVIEDWLPAPELSSSEMHIEEETIGRDTSFAVTENGDWYQNSENITATEYEVTLYIPREYFTIDTVSFVDSFVKALYGMKYAIFIIGGSALLLFIISLVFLCCCAGWKNGEEKPRTSLFDKIPFDIFTIIYALIFTVSAVALFDVYWEGFEWIFVISIYIICASVLLVSYIFSFAARAKTGELFKNTVIWFILKNIFRFLRFIWRGIVTVMSNLPIYLKTVFLLILLAIWSFVIMAVDMYSDPIIIVFWLFGGTIIALYALYITYGIDKLKKGGERIASGDLAYRINTSHMPPSLKKQADALNSIGNGMYAALDERMRSERFKTELITNVSHDLKTPLTSIVNYVDLLKSERASGAPDEEKITEYVEVLERQSERLRKLTSDLVDASKASSGSLERDPSPIDLGEMISQASGEYSERLSELGLELITRISDEPMSVMADGKHLWRIFDNLMNNAAKYSLPGTRVYIDAYTSSDMSFVIFRNTSRYELNISPDELTERFVRGDASRHSEGSGLGLSIAKSLTELNGGRFDIFVDGDLFKVVLGFYNLKNTPKE